MYINDFGLCRIITTLKELSDGLSDDNDFLGFLYDLYIEDQKLDRK